MPAPAGNEVWAEPFSINRQQGIITVIFSTTPHLARDPVVAFTLELARADFSRKDGSRRERPLNRRFTSG